MAKSPYRGISKLYGKSYKNKRIGQCTDVKGDFVCPSCGDNAHHKFVGEHVQHGFYFNRYMEFNHCSACGYDFCLVMQRKGDDYVTLR